VPSHHSWARCPNTWGSAVEPMRAGRRGAAVRQGGGGGQRGIRRGDVVLRGGRAERRKFGARWRVAERLWVGLEGSSGGQGGSAGVAVGRGGVDGLGVSGIGVVCLLWADGTAGRTGRSGRDRRAHARGVLWEGADGFAPLMVFIGRDGGSSVGSLGGPHGCVACGLCFSFSRGRGRGVQRGLVRHGTAGTRQ